MKDLQLELAEGRFAMLRMEPAAVVPVWALEAPGFSAVVRTPTELSLMVVESVVPDGFEGGLERGWRALFVRGTLEFGLVGILAQLAGALAEEGVGILAVSTFDTDWLFVKQEDLERATAALRRRGWMTPEALI